MYGNVTFHICSSWFLPHSGERFEPVALDEFHAAAAKLYGGSSPSQLASLEVALQKNFRAPSFGALGYGPSLLQCCSTDEAMMHVVASVTNVPLNKVSLLV